MYEPLDPYADRLRTMEIGKEDWAQELAEEIALHSGRPWITPEQRIEMPLSEEFVHQMRFQVIAEIAACINRKIVKHSYLEIRKALKKCCAAALSFRFLGEENQMEVGIHILGAVQHTIAKDFMAQFSPEERIKLAREIIDARKRFASSISGLKNLPGYRKEETAEQIIENAIMRYMQMLDDAEEFGA